MTRKYIDCRSAPSENKCTVEISADKDDEVLDLAVMHAVRTHGHQDTPGFREELRGYISSRDEVLR